MSYAPDDLAPLFEAGPPAGAMGFRQGVIVEWNPLTAENKVDVGGTLMTNLTVLNTSEIATLAPGDTVGVAVVGSGGAKTFGILGRMLIPGTSDASKIIDTLRGGSITSAFTLAAGSFTGEQATFADLPGSFGPQLTVNVGRSGRLLVIGSAKVESSNGVLAAMVAQIGNAAPTYDNAVALTALIQADPNDLSIGSAQVREFTGLTPGPVTVTAKYIAEFAAPGVVTSFADRALVAIPL
ncbi:hypothetical protein ACFWC6_32735 [Micromonospora chalcea]